MQPLFNSKGYRIKWFTFRFSYPQDTVRRQPKPICSTTLVIESSANTLCFAALLLALHPDKQGKVFREVTNRWPNVAPTLDSWGFFPLIFLPLLKLEYLRVLCRHLNNQCRNWWGLGSIGSIFVGAHDHADLGSNTTAVIHEAIRIFPIARASEGMPRIPYEGESIQQSLPQGITRSGYPNSNWHWCRIGCHGPTYES